MVEGRQFLIQSASPDWIRRKIFLSDLCVSAVNLILKEGILAKVDNEISHRFTKFNRSCTAVLKYRKTQERRAR